MTTSGFFSHTILQCPRFVILAPLQGFLKNSLAIQILSIPFLFLFLPERFLTRHARARMLPPEDPLCDARSFFCNKPPGLTPPKNVKNHLDEIPFFKGKLTFQPVKSFVTQKNNIWEANYVINLKKVAKYKFEF